MQISDFDYTLPESLIAKYPASERRASRLLVVGDQLFDSSFADLSALLRPGDLLVFNDTRVIPARLHGVKETGGRVEILIERVQDDKRALAHVRASKSPGSGTKLRLADDAEATVLGRRGEFFELEFSVKVLPLLDSVGEVPLPPYLGREAEPDDCERYQTVYAKDPGAVAAPTAGLHFDREMLEETLDAGVRHAYVTLHVGAGTFQALRNEHIEENRLHRERVFVGEATCEAVMETRAAGGRVVAVGTTAVRALETASRGGTIMPFSGETDLFILPGYRFLERRRDDHEFPPAAFLVADAGRRIRRPRACTPGL